MAPNEQRLVKIMIALLIACAAGVFIFVRLGGPGGLSEVNGKIQAMETQLRGIQRQQVDPAELPKILEQLDKLLAREKTKIYKPNEIDISVFGIQVRKLMARNRLTEQNMRTIRNANETSLQFQFKGLAYDFANFLKDVSTNDKYWKIADLAIKAAKYPAASVDVTMRITYETAAQ
jgi:hypothetical protein